MEVNVFKLDVRGIQNKEKVISGCLESFQGRKILDFDVNSKGCISIYYSNEKQPSEKNFKYNVKQVAKRKWNLSAWLGKFYTFQDLNKKWQILNVIETKKEWIILFVNS